MANGEVYVTWKEKLFHNLVPIIPKARSSFDLQR